MRLFGRVNRQRRRINSFEAELLAGIIGLGSQQRGFFRVRAFLRVNSRLFFRVGLGLRRGGSSSSGSGALAFGHDRRVLLGGFILRNVLGLRGGLRLGLRVCMSLRGGGGQFLRRVIALGGEIGLFLRAGFGRICGLGFRLGIGGGGGGIRLGLLRGILGLRGGISLLLQIGGGLRFRLRVCVRAGGQFLGFLGGILGLRGKIRLLLRLGSGLRGGLGFRLRIGIRSGRIRVGLLRSILGLRGGLSLFLQIGGSLRFRLRVRVCACGRVFQFLGGGLALGGEIRLLLHVRRRLRGSLRLREGIGFSTGGRRQRRRCGILGLRRLGGKF